MTNARIKSQNRFCFVGNKKYEYYDVIADSERFGKNEIMFQGTFEQCISYLEQNGINYTEECIKRNRKTDIQVSFRMYRVLEQTEEMFVLKSRDGFERKLPFSDLKPIAPFTFKIKKDLFGRNAATVKMMEARAW